MTYELLYISLFFLLVYLLFSHHKIQVKNEFIIIAAAVTIPVHMYVNKTVSIMLICILIALHIKTYFHDSLVYR